LPSQEVLRLSRELAIRTLQIELEYIYAALEEETADIVGNDMDGGWVGGWVG
jgi:hypothetical protein